MNMVRRLQPSRWVQSAATKIGRKSLASSCPHLFAMGPGIRPLLLLLLLLSLWSRLHRIDAPATVVWDEVRGCDAGGCMGCVLTALAAQAHFGTFANAYLKGQFYVDVHPPLGKVDPRLGRRVRACASYARRRWP